MSSWKFLTFKKKKIKSDEVEYVIGTPGVGDSIKLPFSQKPTYLEAKTLATHYSTMLGKMMDVDPTDVEPTTLGREYYASDISSDVRTSFQILKKNPEGNADLDELCYRVELSTGGEHEMNIYVDIYCPDMDNHVSALKAYQLLF